MFPFSLDRIGGYCITNKKKTHLLAKARPKVSPPQGFPVILWRCPATANTGTSAKQFSQTCLASCRQKIPPLADRPVLRTASGMGETLRFCCAPLYRELPESATKCIRNFLSVGMHHPGGDRDRPLGARICGRSNWNMDMRNDPLQESEFPVTVHSQSRFKCGATFQIELGAANRSSSGFPSPCPCRRAPRIFDSMRAWIPLTPPN